MTDNIIRWERDNDGVVVLTIDDPSGTANTVNDGYLTSMRATVDRLEAEIDDITGVVLTSAKKTFFAGMDLSLLLDLGRGDAQQIMDTATAFKRDIRRLEQIGKPVVAAINGAAVGGGLEIALATHHRIAADLPGVQIGLPEVKLGLLPGGGGVVRTVRMFGLQRALMEILLQGNAYRPAKAKEVGLIDATVDSLDELIPAAKAWIAANGDKYVQPWDIAGYQIPGGTPSTSTFAATLPAFPANLRKQINGTNMPAPRAIMAAAVEGAQVDFANAELIESRYLTSVVTGPVAKNMIRAFFFDLQKVQGGASRPAGIAECPIRNVGVVGAGMMGAGIAYVTAKAGIDVVLKDVTLEAAQHGKAYSEDLEAQAIAKGRSTEAKSRALLDRIRPTADVADFAGVDLVIEAVFEDPALKHKVFGEIEDIIESDALLGSNTSTLPITSLAGAVKRQEDFIGIHFFSPVDKMAPIEIIRGEKTSDDAVARAIDYTLAIKKYPIVVNDSRGFFTSRVFATFLHEACAMLAEGIDPATIEQAGHQAGYPAAPMQLADELNFTTMRRIQQEVTAGLAAEGKKSTEAAEAALQVLETMIDKHGRTGKLGGGGFYDYANGKRTRIWPELRSVFATNRQLTVPFADLIDRFTFIQAIETQRVFDDGVMTSDADANIGSIFAIGYPAWTGGVRRFVDGYPGGRAAFVRRADELAAQYGHRFAVPDSLRKDA
jgi:3-hydroxyacyl-CoA dehydrogenase / enoyl-CoA hydratase / 3-hydroxybutyryl-CoA epimerase